MNKQGFSLIEILVVSTIIGILAAVGAASYSSFAAQSRDARRRADLEQIRAAVEIYRSNDTNASYPTTGITIGCGTSWGAMASYLPKVPNDPKCSGGYAYVYQPQSCSGTTCSNYAIGAFLENTSTCGAGVGGCYSGICNYCVGPYGQR